jgi:phosphatidylserine decarboxylase
MLYATLILGGLALLAVVMHAWPVALLWGLIWVGVLSFFRDPERRVECFPDDLLSPADGVVRDVEEVRPPAFLDGPAVRIGIFMSVLDVHVNRSPADGVVRWVSRHPGSFHDARARDAVTQNEHNFLGLELDDGKRILVNQVAGVLARRIVCEPALGDRLRRGERFGMVKFGSRVELYLPVADEYQVRARPGDRVRAGFTVLATRAARRSSPEAGAQSQAGA